MVGPPVERGARQHYCNIRFTREIFVATAIYGRAQPGRRLDACSCVRAAYALMNWTSSVIVDVFADQHAAGLESRIPGQAEVLAVDLGGRGEADAGIAPGILAGRAGAFDVEGHRTW